MATLDFATYAKNMVRAFSEMLQALRAEGFEPTWTRDTLEFEDHQVIFRSDESVSGLAALSFSWIVSEREWHTLALGFARIVADQPLDHVASEVSALFKSGRGGEIDHLVGNWEMKVRRHRARALMSMRKVT